MHLHVAPTENIAVNWIKRSERGARGTSRAQAERRAFLAALGSGEMQLGNPEWPRAVTRQPEQE